MDKKKLVRMFSAADEDGSGNITKAEMKKQLKTNNCYPGDDFFTAIFKSIDKDGSGELDFDEFVAGVSLIEKLKSKPGNAIAEWKSLFQKADSDSSGNIDKGELKKILKELNAYPGDKEYDFVFKEFDIDDFYRFFKEADADNTGNIDEKEMEKLLRAINLYPGNKEFYAQFQLADCDGSGHLDFEEFVKLIEIFQDNDELKKKFAKLDVDGNGFLDFNEIKRAFKAMNYSISDQAIQDMIAVASLDGDNTVSFEEFCAIARRKKR
ncbi:uncharacterized protein LOC105847916 isoform X4 [Hydra vulgaris]|uniref:Uncharacterized protein LOC105847916 isoform X4 n=1 Tax=Hydra vulgaris TaxID=6087 RepID=A0ABM4C0S0_HYDVU